jgi:hypothetical protein
MKLLDTLALLSLEPSKLLAELLGPAAGEDLQAKVEFRMTPRVVQRESGGVSFEMGVILSCRVTSAGDEGRRDVLRVEHAAIARYQPRPGSATTEAVFRAGHSELGRQLYPLMQQRIAPLFPFFGLAEIRLPLEVVPEEARAPDAATH